MAIELTFCVKKFVQRNLWCYTTHKGNVLENKGAQKLSVGFKYIKSSHQLLRNSLGSV